VVIVKSSCVVLRLVRDYNVNGEFSIGFAMVHMGRHCNDSSGKYCSRCYRRKCMLLECRLSRSRSAASCYGDIHDTKSDIVSRQAEFKEMQDGMNPKTCRIIAGSLCGKGM